MSAGGVRGFLAGLAVGADLETALAIGRTDPGQSGDRFAAAQGDLAAGRTVSESLARLPMMPGLLSLLFGHAAAARRPAIAEYLLAALAPTTRPLSSIIHATKTQSTLWITAVTAIVGLVTLPSLRTLFGAVGAVARPSSNPTAGTLLALAAILLVAAASLAGLLLVRQPHGPWTLNANLSPPTRPLLLLLAAGAEAGVSPQRILAAVERPRHRRAAARWLAALRTPTAANAPSDQAATARALHQQGVLPQPVSEVAAYRWPDEPAGAPWARAAEVADQESEIPPSEWWTHLAVGLCVLGVAATTLAGWHMIAHLAEIPS